MMRTDNAETVCHQHQEELSSALVSHNVPNCSVTLDIKEHSHHSSRPEVDVLICGFNLSKLSRNQQFSVSVLGIFVAYLFYGALQESIFRNNDIQPHSTFLTLFQFFIYAILSYSELWLQKISLKRYRVVIDIVPSRSFSRGLFRLYFLLALLTVGTIAFSNASITYLNYPTQVIFKSCKMIPVLIGGVLLQRKFFPRPVNPYSAFLGKSYSALEVTAVLVMTVGLISFTLVDVSVQPSFTFFGVVLVSLALCCDGALGNYQELVMRKMRCCNTELLFYSYTIGFVVLLCGIIMSGQFLSSVRYFVEHPGKMFGHGVVFSICGYFGLHFVLCLVQSHGALTAVTVTTFRKAVTMILSFILFDKPFAMGYVWSALLVVFGLYLNLYSKHRQSWDNYVRQQLYRFGIIKCPLPAVLPL
ncbi:adenosine 3'-phospho 5'-phosphosulfate transporter 2 [Clonorchis sinensis]|uniref:Adenosine 3'-phospho 5'-phosphosulfate transporter 2 n=1 Tax=Clonorchis sinensis TaxID=79923 RepID=G7YWQ9_CLOSI|nr:adenosine 3'-phospho 5'-phosphosulfate transporter 2 [Clonorchis sinensis]